MKADERTISRILTEQTCYQIPPYQRPYSWRMENVQELLDDLWNAFSENDSEYFIGSLITIEREPDRKYDVVDGQQRLITLNLIFLQSCAILLLMQLLLKNLGNGFYREMY